GGRHPVRLVEFHKGFSAEVVSDAIKSGQCHDVPTRRINGVNPVVIKITDGKETIVHDCNSAQERVSSRDHGNNVLNSARGDLQDSVILHRNIQVTLRIHGKSLCVDQSRGQHTKKITKHIEFDNGSVVSIAVVQNKNVAGIVHRHTHRLTYSVGGEADCLVG